MKYIKEIIGGLCIILLTIFMGSWDYVIKLSTLFIPMINRYIYIFISLSFIYMMARCILNTNKTNKIGLIIVYSIILFLTLFVRKKYDTFQYNFEFYLLEWVKKMFVDKVVFVNLMGNLVLFMPLGFILSKINKNKLCNILIGMGIVIVLELCQFISKRGVFDIIDILLNGIGLILLVLLTRKGDIANVREKR